MIFTLLCQMLLLESWTNAFPQEPSSSRTTHISTIHLPLKPPINTNTDTSSTNLITNTNTLVSLDVDLKLKQTNTNTNQGLQETSRISRFSREQRQKPSSITSTSNLNQRQRREAKPQSDWIFPTFNPPNFYTRRPYTPSGTSSYGLAYRSILPIRNVNTNHYTEFYRNRNIFNNNDNEYNYNSNRDQYQQPGTTQDKNDIQLDSTKQNNANVNPSPTTRTTTTAQSRTKSVPATEPGSLSSTLEMKDDYSDLHVGSRDAIGSGIESRAIGKARQPKVHKPDEQDSIITFPGNISRPSKRHGTRPGKATLQGNDDDYMPPPLKTLDKAALESLKMLLETRRKAQSTFRTNTKSGQRGRGSQSQSQVEERGSSTELDIKTPPKCATKNSGYCEEIDSYPKEFFNQILKNSLTLSPDVFQEVFGDSIDNKTDDSELVSRDGLNLMLDSPLCTSIEHTIYPKVAENKEGKFMYIVNHDEYIQGVRVEKCVKENSPCMYLEGSLTGYQSSCRQKYIYRKLLAFTRDGKATTDTFRLPACCVCHVRSTFVDDRINTAGFSSSGTDSDYVTGNVPPVSVSSVLAKHGDDTGDNSNSTVVGAEDENSEAVTEMIHDDFMTFPTTVPDSYLGASSAEVRKDVSASKINGTLPDSIISGPYLKPAMF